VESVLLIREFEKEPVYELVEVLRFERGRRYVYRLATGEREYFVHVVTLRESAYVEFWHPGYAVPILVFHVSSGEELSRVLILLRSLLGR
jgi:hypothetical protein